MARAVLAALLLHVGLLLFVRFPIERGGELRGPLLVHLEPAEVDRPPADPSPASAATLPRSGAGQGARSRPFAEASPFPVTAIPFLRQSAPAGEATMIHAATLPLVVAPGGGIVRRRLERTPEQLATARAESLLFARMEGIGVAPARDTGAVGLANGGITVAVPWQGFLPASRGDGTWRKERCSGDGDGKSDKAGEGEARRAQCG